MALMYSPEHRCGDCYFDTYAFTMARSHGVYRGALKEVIHLFKFEKRKNLVTRLSRLLHETFIEHFNDLNIEWIVPVPLHKKRYQERGFNQCEMLARGLGKRSRIAVSANNLIKVKHTQPQTGLTDKQRSKNVKNAFRVRKPKQLAGRRVLLVDDVFTTGATLNECTRALKRAGAREVYVLTLARVTHI
jgi:ComF family protein